MKVAVFILVFLFLLATAIFAIQKWIQYEPPAAPATSEVDQNYEPRRATMTGTQTCLPHKDQTGPQTKECQPGFKSDDGKYYGLDFALMSQIPPTINNGDRFTASGVIVPIERLSTDHWQKYNAVGIFSITDGITIVDDTEKTGGSILDLLPKAPVPVNPDVPKESEQSAACYVGGCSSQICSDQPDMVSDCMYRPEYACYQGATCERQSNGQCGWTQTQELKACLSTNAGAY